MTAPFLERTLRYLRPRAGALGLAVPAALLVLFLAAPAGAQTTVDVTTLTDEFGENPSGCSLREAVETFNTGADFGGCTRTGTGLPRVVDVPSATHRLTRDGFDDATNADGEIVINTSMQIIGDNPDFTLVDADGIDRVFETRNLGFSAGAEMDVLIEKLRIVNGVPENEGNGGGLLVGRNTALTLLDSRVEDNEADDAEGGGIYVQEGASATITETTIANNEAGGSVTVFQKGGGGGGVYVAEEAELTLLRSSVVGNQAGDGGFDDDDDGGDGGDGGGLYVARGATATVLRSTLRGNTAGDGGYSDAEDGGNGGNGGGLFSKGADVEVIASTVSGNAAGERGCEAGQGDDCGRPGEGGGLYAVDTTGSVLRVSSTTVAQNEAETGGGIGVGPFFEEGGTFEIENTIIAGNTEDGNASANDADCGSALEITALGYNLVGQGTGCGDLAGTNEGRVTVPPSSVFADVLEPLADDGGPTQTHALISDADGDPNPALDAGRCPDLMEDQRGEQRPYDVPGVPNATSGGCDIGAVEAQSDEVTTDALPVARAVFVVKAEGRDALLKWRTATETDSDGFWIERTEERRNGRTEEWRNGRTEEWRNGRTEEWTRVAFVESKAEGGTSQEPIRYQFRAEDLDYGEHTFRLVQQGLGGTEAPVGAEQTVEIGLTRAYELSEAYPNPARSRTALTLAVAEAQPVRAALYDALGRQVRVLFEGRRLPAGEAQRIEVETETLASGVYLLRVTGADFAATRRVVVLR